MTDDANDSRRRLDRAVRRKRAHVEQYLAARVANPDDARELAQEAFMRLLRLEDAEFIQQPEAYLFRIAVNLAYEHELRQKASPIDTYAVVEEDDEALATSKTTDDLAMLRQRIEQLEAALSTMPPNVQAALVYQRREDGELVFTSRTYAPNPWLHRLLALYASSILCSEVDSDLLDKGEAFFDAAKDRNRPFTVNSGGQSVTALGTKFNVKRIEAELTVAVIEGVVAVHQARDLEGAADIIAGQAVPSGMGTPGAEGQHRLEAGAVATFTERSQVVAQTALPDIERIHSWREGLLRFDGERFEHVVSELERYMIRDIEIGAPATGDLEIIGVFRLDDEEGIWRGLELVLPVRVDDYPDRVVITAR